jgi:hypothetical protein
MGLHHLAQPEFLSLFARTDFIIKLLGKPILGKCSLLADATLGGHRRSHPSRGRLSHPAVKESGFGSFMKCLIDLYILFFFFFPFTTCLWLAFMTNVNSLFYTLIYLSRLIFGEGN